MSITHILVALSLDADSQRVAERAVQLAQQHDARLIAVHILSKAFAFDDNIATPSDIAATASTAINHMKDGIAQQMQSLLSGAADPILHIEQGRKYEVIERLAQSYGASLIILGSGSGGTKGLKKKLFGSTADRLARLANFPILLVRNPAAAPYRHIAVGMDFSNHAKAATTAAKALFPAAFIDLIHAVNIPLPLEQAMLKTGTSQADITAYRNALAASARKQARDTFGTNGRLPDHMRIQIVHGDPAAQLLKASRRKSIDLMALGAQGSSGLARNLLGSVARKLLQSARSDVLIIPNGAAD